jgi:hypothetical protein
MRTIEANSLTESGAQDFDPDWLLPELSSALRARRPPEDLGLRQLLEFPEVALRHADAERRFRRRSITDLGPDWPDAA